MFNEEDQEDVIAFEKDEDLKETEGQIGELLKSKERTPEQEAELSELKKKRQGRYDERLRELTAARRKEADRAARAEAEAETLRKRLEERNTDVIASKTTQLHREQVNINGRNFYTDRALNAMVQSGEMSQESAWEHQQERMEEKAVLRLKTEQEKDSVEKIKEETIKDVLREYPHFNPQHPNHNPNDPLYREASRLLANGYGNNPRGIKLAIEDAKKILGSTSKRPDLSEELSVTTSGNSTNTVKVKTTELTDYETENAYRFYVMGGQINPATQKVYTRAEAIQKTMKAKQQRQAALSTRR